MSEEKPSFLGTHSSFLSGARQHRWTATVIVLWLATYPALLALNHLTLRTNGYDLSVFDYALWSSLHGRLGYVPFMGQSLFAQHFMPTLLALLPVYVLWPAPGLLIAVQLVSIFVAALLLWRFAAGKLPPILVAAFVAAFLFSRRSHAAEISVFYVEALEPMFVLALVLAAAGKHWKVYFVLLLLALGCKEDMAVYLGLFGMLLVFSFESRRIGVATIFICAVWLAGAVLVAIPSVRATSGLSAANPFVAARYGTAGGGGIGGVVAAATDRLLSERSAAKFVTLSSGVLLTCWLAPEWLVIAVPGIALDLAASPDTLQAGLTGHYLWPILPWLFVAGVVGSVRLIGRWPRSVPWLVAGLFLVTLVDAPIRGALWKLPWRDLPAATEVRARLAELPPDADVLAQPNLIPHISHRWGLRALASDAHVRPEDDVVLLSPIGDLWPFTTGTLGEMRARIARDSTFSEFPDGPLIDFRRRP
jgi:uncharacterized membrane protein